MAVCSNCGEQVAEGAKFCPKCGTVVQEAPKQEAPQQQAPQQQAPQQQAPNYGGYAAAPNMMDPYDHTREFTPKDISDNKVVAMLVYLLGIGGIIIALLGSQTSPYVGFHVRQSLKFVVVEALLGIITALLCWTVIIPIASGICYIVLFVCKIICFFSICGGNAKEPPIIRSFGFLR